MAPVRKPELFNFFTYAENLLDMLKTAFPDEFGDSDGTDDPKGEISFPPTAQGYTDSRFGDPALPAFLINFESPEVPEGETNLSRRGIDLEDDDNYYMPMKIRLTGYVLVPVFPEYNPLVPNTNTTLLLAQAASNIAAKIHASAQGWGCGPATIDEISFIDDSTEDEERNYHVGEIHWSHDVYVGSEPTVSGVVPNTVFNRFAIPEGADPPDASHEVYPDRGDPEPTP